MIENKPKQFLENLQPFEVEKYAGLNGDRLVVFAVGLLSKNGAEPLFENIVVVAFKLFPEMFSLVGFPQYPDSKRVRDSLFHCTYKTKGWLIGSTQAGWGGKSGFFLTEKGKGVFTEVEKILEGEATFREAKSKIELKVDLKQKSIIQATKKLDAYILFQKGDLDKISEYDLKRALRGTRSTAIPKLLNNYEKLKKYGLDLGDEEFLRFLDFVKKRILEIAKVK